MERRHCRLSPSAIVVVAVVCSSLARSARGGESRWKPASPGGGPIAALVQSPLDPQLWYAAAPEAVYRSRDGGAMTYAPSAWKSMYPPLSLDFLCPVPRK